MTTISIALLGVLLATTSVAAPITIDPSASKLSWEGSKIGGKHQGEVKLKSGSVLLNKQSLTGGSFEINMASIINLDISDTIYNAKLIDHLKSDDFFSVQKNPVAKFKITKVKTLTGDAEGNTHLITGDLSIKGITKPVTFPAKVNTDGKTFAAKAKVTIDRTKYDIKYRSKSFFKDLGDKVIHDTFHLNLDLNSKNI